MELILKNDLPHQQRGINAIGSVFTENDFRKNTFYYQNPILHTEKSTVLSQIQKAQKVNEVPIDYIRHNKWKESYLNLDIKMETGTGKTYVYTAAMYELHKRLGINKFIVVVPTLAIKAGAKQFLSDAYTQQHFRDVCGYDTEIELFMLEAQKAKKGKKYFPSAVREFVSGSSQNTNKIYVLLTNMSLFSDRKDAMLNKNDYGYGVEGFYRPSEAIGATKPFLIIDEPHRFSRDQKTFEYITNEIKPQCILRFGATFPTITIGSGKNKTTQKDYQNVLYDLNACDAFNQNLIKGIAKEHFEPLSKREDKIKIVSVESRKSVKFNHIQRDKPTKSYQLEKNDSLSLISEAFEGITIEAIGKNFIELSNGQIKFQGEEFSTDIYAASYQEQMLRLAIDRHFETERANFSRPFKIKTLALFFIDDIYSYRKNEKSEKEPYLKNTFEILLTEKINHLLLDLKDDENDYKAYLEATLQDVSLCHAGYFSQDNSDSDESIGQEINEILFDKKGLLTIQKEDKTYNTRRFLFSKWTLKEGWDNPNVFTITKLRSSGSENSKIQEVGRGLRLPVDEHGNRISNEDFKLNYIIDFTEADFAEKLVKEINAELPQGYAISKEKLELVALTLETTSNALFKKLLIADYIDMERNIISENVEQFFEAYPEFATGLRSNKITDNNKKTEQKIKIRKERFDELKDLWSAINQRYLLVYEKVEANGFFKNELVKLLEKDIFVEVTISSKRQEVRATDGLLNVNEGTGLQYTINKTIFYSDILKKKNKQTNIPITLLNDAIQIYAKNHTLSNDKINDFSVTNFVTRFGEWKVNNLQGRFEYHKSSLQRQATALTNSDGSVKNELKHGIIGTKISEGTPIGKYLYDTIAYDSPLEKENIMTDIEEVIVYGKIPRNSISIPTIVGENYSPDFMYVVKKISGEKTLNIIVETKNVENQSSLRKTEETKIDCARFFFNQLSIDGYKVEFHTQINNKRIHQIVKDVLAE